MKEQVHWTRKCPDFTVPNPILSFLYSGYDVTDPETRNWLIFIVLHLPMMVQFMYFTKVPSWGDDWRLTYTVTLCLCESRDIFVFVKRFYLFTKAYSCRTKSNYPFQICLKILYMSVACAWIICICVYPCVHTYFHSTVRGRKIE